MFTHTRIANPLAGHHAGILVASWFKKKKNTQTNQFLLQTLGSSRTSLFLTITPSSQHKHRLSSAVGTFGPQSFSAFHCSLVPVKDQQGLTSLAIPRAPRLESEN